MRALINLVEGILPTLYHGSRTEFEVGTILTPQDDGYVVNFDADEQHHMLERAMERYRPAHCVPRAKSVFLIADPEDIDNAGGYNDFVYETSPVDDVSKCNLAWYSEAYALCEHEVLSAEEAQSQGMDWYGEYGEEPELKQFCLNYWNAVPHGPGDLMEYLCLSARITRVVD